MAGREAEDLRVARERLLKGETPGYLPVQPASAFEIIINLKGAKESVLRYRMLRLFAPTK